VIPKKPYRGRLAPSPTGYLHLGHAKTFWTAQQRADATQGTLVLRIEDLDSARCQARFLEATLEDLRWFGFHWQEGPDVGGSFAPYLQSERMQFYREALGKLKAAGYLYPCRCSRQDVLRALNAPHAGEEEPLYPGTCRPSTESCGIKSVSQGQTASRINWRFRVPDGEPIEFTDKIFGPQKFIAGADFGDFVVWRHDDIPAYHLAVVVDDSQMRISEVVRGADLLSSTARQLLLYRALGWTPPEFAHCELVTDAAGHRLAKRDDALSLRRLREHGTVPTELREGW
jgi:glutamyl-tRNA synthetase